MVALSRRGLLPGRWPPGVSVRAAGYAGPQALGAAIRDVDTLVFVSSDGPAAQVMVHHQNVIRAAAAGGVAHIVALSGLDADLSSPFCYAVSYGYTEGLLAESGCTVSIARASIYSEFLAGFLARARASGKLRLAAADGQISLVSRSDVARCLAALALAPARGRHHDITGSQSLGLDAIAAAGTHQWGTALKYVNITPGDHCVDMAAAGGSMVDVRILDDVRVDSRTALGGGLRRGPSPDRTPANASPHRARPLQDGLMERHDDRPTGT